MGDFKQKAFEFVDNHRDEMLLLWKELVNIESGSQNKEGVDLMASKIRDAIVSDGASVQIVEFEKAGNMLVACYGSQREKEPVAFIGHMDTVFPKGTVDPFAIKDGKAYGPGVLDMKGGIVALLYAIKALESAGYNRRPFKVILAGDEECAHVNSNAVDIIRQEVTGSIAAFNCETGFINDQVVVGRNGAATFTMETHGVAAHTGNNPHGGRSAILELAHKVIDVHALTDFDKGTLFNVGTIKGGIGFNVTPDYAKIEIGVRCTTEAAMSQITDQLKKIAGKTYVEGTKTVLTSGPHFMPMDTTDAVTKLFELVAHTAQENGFRQLTPVHVGGASDSGYAVIAGIPTVCGMGVKGENNHSPKEYAVVESLFERTKLLAACVLNLENWNKNEGGALT